MSATGHCLLPHRWWLVFCFLPPLAFTAFFAFYFSFLVSYPSMQCILSLSSFVATTWPLCPSSSTSTTLLPKLKSVISKSVLVRRPELGEGGLCEHSWLPAPCQTHLLDTLCFTLKTGLGTCGKMWFLYGEH